MEGGLQRQHAYSVLATRTPEEHDVLVSMPSSSAFTEGRGLPCVLHGYVRMAAYNLIRMPRLLVAACDISKAAHASTRTQVQQPAMSNLHPRP